MWLVGLPLICVRGGFDAGTFLCFALGVACYFGFWVLLLVILLICLFLLNYWYVFVGDVVVRLSSVVCYFGLVG